jgi:hypothetical protein
LSCSLQESFSQKSQGPTGLCWTWTMPSLSHRSSDLAWPEFSCAIIPTGMLNSLSWPKDLAESVPHGEVRVPHCLFCRADISSTTHPH